MNIVLLRYWTSRGLLTALSASLLVMAAPGCSGGDSDAGVDTSVDETAGDPTGDGDGDGDGAGDPPTVQAEPTYDVIVSTETYGEGQRHLDWNGPTDGVRELLLDVYEPIDAPPGRPAVVMIHGGGFKGGTREDMNMVEFSQHFAQRGFVVVSIDYRVVNDRGTLPQAWMDVVTSSGVSAEQQEQGMALYAAARDAKAAVRWFGANADTYQLDADYVTAIGGSAGSYLAIMLGVTNPEDFRDELTVAEDPTLATTNLGAGGDVHTIIDHWGGITHMEILELIDGTSRFDASDAPVSIVHGKADLTVPYEEAEKLRLAYKATGVPYAIHALSATGHGAWGAIVDGQNLRELAFDFVVEQQGLTVQP